MPTITPNLGLKLLEPGQAQKEVRVNEALLRIDDIFAFYNPANAGKLQSIDGDGNSVAVTVGTGLALASNTLSVSGIGTGALADGAVTEPKIADGAVTAAKVGGLSSGQIVFGAPGGGLSQNADLFYSTNQLRVPGGTIAAPGMSFSASADMGFARINAATMTASVGGVSVAQFDASGIVAGSGTAASGMAIDVRAVAGQSKSLYFRSGTSLRWAVSSSAAAESGSDAGSVFTITRYSDAGTSLGAVVSIDRATGTFSLPGQGSTNGLLLGTDMRIYRVAAAVLEAAGQFRTSHASDASILSIRTGGATVKLEGGGSAGFFKTTTNHPLNFGANNTDFMVLDTTGRVQITNAAGELSVGLSSSGLGRINLGGTYSAAPQMVNILGTLATTGVIAAASIWANARFEGFSATSSIRNIVSVPLVAGANNASFAAAHFARVDTATGSTANITDVYGFYFVSGIKSGTGVITNQTGVYIPDLSGTYATNNYAIRTQVAAGSNKWNLYLDGSASNAINGAVFFGGTSAPSARVHIGAGAASAGAAPLKIGAGTNLTTPEAGAIECDGVNLFYTQVSGPTRKTLAFMDSSFSAAQITSGTLAVDRGGTGLGTGFTKGDILVATGAATLVRLPVGADGLQLTADSTQPSGLKWA